MPDQGAGAGAGAPGAPGAPSAPGAPGVPGVPGGPGSGVGTGVGTGTATAGAGSPAGGGLFWLHPIKSAVAAESSNTLNALAFMEIPLISSFARKRHVCALRAKTTHEHGLSVCNFHKPVARDLSRNAGNFRERKNASRGGVSNAAHAEERGTTKDTPTGRRSGCRINEINPYLRRLTEQAPEQEPVLPEQVLPERERVLQAPRRGLRPEPGPAPERSGCTLPAGSPSRAQQGL